MKAVALRLIAEPACWSWPVPTLLPDEKVTQLLAQHEIPPHISRGAFSGPAAAWRFVAFHAGRCAICGNVVGLLVVDHRHGPQTVRGCLCYGCNVLEGRRDIDLPVIAAYRSRHPALILGYDELYRGNGASQRIVRAVHADARTYRFRVLRIAAVTSDIRQLTQLSRNWHDEATANRITDLIAAWRRVRLCHAQLGDDLCNAIASALTCGLAVVSAIDPDLPLDAWRMRSQAETVEGSIRFVLDNVREEMGLLPPIWIPPWMR
jgi:hypothetical protein